MFTKEEEGNITWTRNEGLIDNLIPKRGKGIKKSDTKKKDIYQFYKDNLKPISSILSNEETIGEYDISSKLHSDILKDIHTGIQEIMILENFEYKIPYSLGLLSLKQKKIKVELNADGELDTNKLKVDYKATRDLWKSDKEAMESKSLIFYTNEHTNGNRMSWWWSKKGAKTLGIGVYYFKPCREMSRIPAKYLKDKSLNLQYFEAPKKLAYMMNPKYINKNKQT